ncbi:kinase-like domain-containing protein [Aspergillus taichungensis]|uniref:Kinase-like domain-containing protein n=1 Tax=Aspergillus taichungensis TaxID=482145 RepID=A0A2J5HWR4_9EURO|nr:kinase-like domain-containing protein [Aspergillus taichungensis]
MTWIPGPSTMFSFIRTLYLPVLSTFRMICYPINVVVAFVCNSLLGWKPTKSDVQGPCQSSLSGPNTVASAAANDLPIHPAHVKVIQTCRYYPPGVSEIIGRGGESFIGLVDESTVLKYPCVPGDRESIEIEAELLAILGDHPRILASKGLNEYGLMLQYAPNGNLYERVTSELASSFDQKLRWCKQAAEAVKYIHEKRIIHCDINLRNFLLDDNHDLLLADFQGMLKSTHGETVLDGLSRECSKSFMPRIHGDFADVKTDLFALGSAVYFIMLGHEVFPELDSLEDDEQIASRFQSGQFPTDSHACSKITDKCWRQLYESAEDILFDISQVQASKGEGSENQDIN